MLPITFSNNTLFNRAELHFPTNAFLSHRVSLSAQTIFDKLRYCLQHPALYVDRAISYLEAQVDKLTPETLGKIALGIGVALPMIFINQLITNKIVELAIRQGLITLPESSIISLIPISGVQNLVEQALVISLSAFAVLIAPITEEHLFRDLGFRPLSKGETDPVLRLIQTEAPNNLTERVSRIVKNGLIFGAIHLPNALVFSAFYLSPSLLCLSIPIFCATSLMGCALATLRDITGDTTAPIAAHMMNNGFVAFQLLKG